MPPNTVNNNSDNVHTVNRKKDQIKKNEKSEPKNAQLDKNGSKTDYKTSIGIAIVAVLIVIFSPTILKQLAQFKRYITKAPLDSRPLMGDSSKLSGSTVIDPDTGVEYEYHQFMATTEQHFSNIR